MTPRDDIPRVSPGVRRIVWATLAIFGLACLYGLGVLLVAVLP